GPGTRSMAPAASSASRWYCAARTPLNPKARAISACDGGMPSASMRSAIRARMACWVSDRSMVSSNTTNKPSLQLPQSPQRRRHGLAAHVVAVALEVEELGACIAAAALPADPDGADRLVVAAAAGAGDAGHRDRDGGAGVDERAG